MTDDDEELSTEPSMAPIAVRDEPTGQLTSDARLLCIAGDDLGRSFRVGDRSMLIGRGDDAEVALRSSKVSRRHARIVRSGRGFAIVDLSSANGTFVNGRRVASQTPLVFGDRIEIGRTILLFNRHDELEERMRRLQRLEAIGTLASGVAHDFNNALTVITTGIDLIRAHVTLDADLAQIIDDMTTAASSSVTLVSRLLQLGRSDSGRFETLAPAELVERAVSPIRHQAGAKLVVEVRVPRHLEVYGSRDDLYHVVLNLLLNARDAMPDGGTLSISAQPVTYDASHAIEHHLPAPGAFVEISVSDTGMGMDEQTMLHLFEPFFTTKPRGKGTGLGLATAHGVVQRHGGAILVTSRPRVGTTFRVILPASTHRAATEQP